jgi:hypothetical protein
MAWAKSHPQIFDCSGLEAIFGPGVQLAPCSSKGGFNSFAPDFIYSYVKAGELTFGQLHDATDVILGRVAAWKDDDWHTPKQPRSNRHPADVACPGR